ncbi:hypothetical protein NDU88_002070 [Pleurodeles waltl]|uniref:Uncharacterized protein n=1 Tax=Pleurodeles waltl TaxID=8319 RepID=A0AAV7LBE8_PLEWA|nr:hypothetical protein NDU88_002069 [Pleurodeles waltl]KAJ1088916.1 hypothetical protein NDU88_002070 [Pleurodeles waltl]
MADLPILLLLRSVAVTDLLQGHSEEQSISEEVSLASILLAAVASEDANLSTKATTVQEDMKELQQLVAEAKDVGTATVKTIGNHDQQLIRVHSKIEDQKNHQWRNNLRVFSILERKEGDDPLQFMVQLFGKAFPDLSDSDMDSQILQAHRLPITQNSSPPSDRSKVTQPQPILIYIGNFLL